MARNRVQFQKGLSELEFERRYGTEEQCRAAIVASRWPDGFVCPACGGTGHSPVKTRGLHQCSACRTQTSPIAGTIFAATELKLRIWFRALCHLTQTKQGISSIEPARSASRGDTDNHPEDQAQTRPGDARARQRQAVAPAR